MPSMNDTPNEGALLHATAVAIDAKGVLMRGVSGSGKSDLALRLIDAGAVLIADDYVQTEIRNGVLLLSPPETIAGKLEVRGIGIVEPSWADDVPLALVIDLVTPERVERLPDRTQCTLRGIAIPSIALTPFEASAGPKVRFALKALDG